MMEILKIEKIPICTVTQTPFLEYALAENPVLYNYFFFIYIFTDTS